MKTIASIVMTGLTTLTLACGGNGGSNSSNTAANDAGRNGDSSRGEQRELTGCLLAGGDAGSYVLQLGSVGDAARPRAVALGRRPALPERGFPAPHTG